VQATVAGRPGEVQAAMEGRHGGRNGPWLWQQNWGGGAACSHCSGTGNRDENRKQGKVTHTLSTMTHFL
jgi:hypothetical protein